MTLRRRVSWLLVLTIWAVVVSIPVILRHDSFLRGPVQEGRTLSSWLRRLEDSRPEIRAQAGESIRQLGPRALPLIDEWLDWKESTLRRVLNRWISTDPRINYYAVEPAERRRLALSACDVLGPVAQPAIPKLVAIATGRNPELDAPYIIARLGGSNAPAALGRISVTGNKYMRAGAVVATGLLRENSHLLTARLADNDYDHRLKEYRSLVMQTLTSNAPARIQ